MTLQQAKYLLSIKQHGSVTRASKELFVAQSSLSATIKEVEKEYGLELFRRNSRGVELTLRGREFMEDVQHMLDQYDFINEKYNGPPVEEVHLCVSSQHHICGEGAFLKLIAQYQSKKYRLGYLEGSTEQLLDNVETGVSDFGILFYYLSVKPILIQDLRNRGMVFNHIAYRRPHIYVHHKHPLAGQKSIRPEELKNYPSITYDSGGSGASLYTATLRKATLRPQTFLVTERASADTLMRHTTAYAVGSGYPAEDEAYNDIISIPIEGDEELEIGYIIRAKQHLSEAAEKMVELIKQLYMQ